MRNFLKTSFSGRHAGTLLALLLYVALACAVIWHSEESRIDYERTHASHLADERAMAIQSHIENTLSSTYAVATLLRLGKGEVPEFDAMAAVLHSFYPGIAAIQLAPGGTIRQIYPLAGNERALGLNLLADPEQRAEAARATESGRLTLAGPFPLVQGGLGAAGRLPVYLNDGQGQPHFWGFVIVLLRFPELLAPGKLSLLSENGYDYELWRIHPASGVKHVIASSSEAPLMAPVERPLRVPNGTWTLSVAPAKGWLDLPGLALKTGLAVFILILLAAIWRKPAA